MTEEKGIEYVDEDGTTKRISPTAGKLVEEKRKVSICVYFEQVNQCRYEIEVDADSQNPREDAIAKAKRLWISDYYPPEVIGVAEHE